MTWSGGPELLADSDPDRTMAFVRHGRRAGDVRADEVALGGHQVMPVAPLCSIMTPPLGGYSR